MNITTGGYVFMISSWTIITVVFVWSIIKTAMSKLK